MKRSQSIVIYALLFAYSLFLYWPLFGSVVFVDDALIYLRVVENLLNGDGWIYNHNEVPINPCSSPIYTLLLYVLALPLTLLGDSPPLLALLSVVTALCGYLIFALIFAGLAPYGAIKAIMASLIVGSSTTLMKSPGLETHFYSVCILATAILANRRYHWSLGITLGITALVRPEALMLPFIVFTLLGYRDKKLALAPLFSCGAVIISWYLFASLYFGEPLPHSAYAKIGQAQSMPDTAGVQLSLYFQIFFARALVPAITWTFVLLGVYAAARAVFRKQLFVPIVVCFGVGQTFAYGILHAQPGYIWYMVPGDIAFNMLFALGGYFALDTLGKQLAAHISTRTLVLGRILTALPFTVLGILYFSMYNFKPMQPIWHGPHYIEAARWVKDNTPTEASLASAEIGYMGYYSKRNIVDPFGLIHRDAPARIDQSNLANWWLLAKSPDYIVKNLTKKERQLMQAQDERFEYSQYRKVYDTGRFVVLEKRPPAKNSNSN